jgi:transmembrane sensor
VYDRPNGDTRVSVLEGRVRVTARSGQQDDGPNAESELLVAGEEVDIHLDGTVHRNSKAVVANTVAWRQRRLVFENAGLEEMVGEFNRYNRSLRLRLEDVPAGAYRYSGVFDAADPESFVSVLEKEPDLLIERRGEDVIVRPRASTQ